MKNEDKDKKKSKTIPIIVLISWVIVCFDVFFIQPEDERLLFVAWSIVLVPNIIAVLANKKSGIHAFFTCGEWFIMCISVAGIIKLKFDFNFYMSVLQAFDVIALELVILYVKHFAKKEYEPWDNVEKYENRIDYTFAIIFAILLLTSGTEMLHWGQLVYASQQAVVAAFILWAFSLSLWFYVIRKAIVKSKRNLITEIIYTLRELPPF
jgi:hypothetical protein